MDVDWNKFETEVLDQCAGYLDKEDLAHGLFRISVIAATTAVRRYHELVVQVPAESPEPKP